MNKLQFPLILFPLILLTEMATGLPMSKAYAGSRHDIIVHGTQNDLLVSNEENCGEVNWVVNADGTSSKVVNHDCVTIKGHIYADDANTDVEVDGDGEADVYPAACDNPYKTRKWISGHVVIIPHCNPR
ncbi:hypothetical protein [Mesorhizobium sp.]|uniref:hypothetical protein n=1 Tax=Mesorhizobium sp. TaxID=1871066 RepID=UPI000FE35C21|nr:hypothetical protein [Mesorhizobium sp.]RWK28723.1 MAG: hypothetical protein EOR40_28285 [Mesorhizobium sp.]RWK91036.1 MAG: hypothetical protein EOR52_05760 [Mesorhizobium sp.]TIP17941.1 MAG: hypothetical protein E5X66_19010 [Mesorhizobium sp.]TJV81342.1 MAG: hypothetical protein E5X45_16975 [Mesorhizobium sp.]TJW17217.1 MAG: hypothetical protein E5X42_16150 [Mesorhizobium sp.]